MFTLLKVINYPMISHSVLSLHDLKRAFDRDDLSFHLEILSSLGFQDTLPFSSYFSLVMAFASSTSPAQPHNAETPLLTPSVISSSLMVFNTHICQWLPNIKLQLRLCFWTWDLYSNCLVKELKFPFGHLTSQISDIFLPKLTHPQPFVF